MLRTLAAGACATMVTLAIPARVLGQHQHDEPATGPAVVIEVEMRDHAFSPANLRVPAGQPVTLVFRNTGAVEHEFMAGRRVTEGDFGTDLFAGIEVATESDMDAMMHDHHDDAAAAPHDHDDAAAAPHDHGAGDHGTMVSVEPGQHATMTFTLPVDRRGEWETACFLPNHYERGMHGSLIVY